MIGYTVTAGRDQHAFITGPNGVGITDIGTLGGENSVAEGINGAGRVAGWSETAGGSAHAFITGPNGAGMTDLGTLGGFSALPRQSIPPDRSQDIPILPLAVDLVLSPVLMGRA